MVAAQRPSTANLKPPINKRPPEEQKAICQRGGVASGKARRAKKQKREQLEDLMGVKVATPSRRKKLETFGIKKSEQNNQMAAIVSLFEKALKGDVKAFLAIRDTLGQNPDKPAQIAEQGGRKVEIVDDLPDGED